MTKGRAGEIAGFAILEGLLSEHGQVELKRLVVRTPNEGVGKELLGDAVYRDGSYHSLVLMSLLESEYRLEGDTSEATGKGRSDE